MKLATEPSRQSASQLTEQRRALAVVTGNLVVLIVLCLPLSILPAIADSALLRILRSSGDPIEVVMRYSGCDHNGFDDGAAVRRLTPESGTALVDGANFVSGYSGTAEKTAALHPESAAAAREKEHATR